MNSLSGLIGNIDFEKYDENQNIHPEIIFHSPYCPLPPNLSRARLRDGNQMSPHFKGPGAPFSSNEEKSSSDYSCHNPDCNHERALCRVYNQDWHPIAFKDICPSHPCYLVMDRTPDSKKENSNLQSSTPEKAYGMNAHENEELDNQSPERAKKPMALPKVENKSKRKGKNVLRLKTKISDNEKGAAKRSKNAKNSEGSKQ